MLKSSKFTEIDEEFICENCGKKVPKLGYSCRNHCPYCLHSKHIDINPGDREETCHGVLEPVGLDIDSKKGYVIIFKCKKCGAIRKNKAAKDDDMDAIIKLSFQQGRSFLKISLIFSTGTVLFENFIIFFKKDRPC
ncbi:MAG: RNHCP domain-containing protein [Clostridia bacterium]|nr:RNHCP domain-containing protein [Clostridia bacterium]